MAMHTQTKIRYRFGAWQRVRKNEDFQIIRQRGRRLHGEAVYGYYLKPREVNTAPPLLANLSNVVPDTKAEETHNASTPSLVANPVAINSRPDLFIPPPAQLGVVVPNKVYRRAHDRNRIKRIIRELFRLRQHQLQGRWIIGIRKKVDEKILIEEVIKLLSKEQGRV